MNQWIIEVDDRTNMTQVEVKNMKSGARARLQYTPLGLKSYPESLFFSLKELTRGTSGKDSVKISSNGRNKTNSRSDG